MRKIEHLDFITQIVTHFHDIFYNGLDNVKGYVLAVTLGLITIDGTFFFIGTFWGGGLMAGWFNKLIKYAFYILIVSEFPTMVEQFLTGFYALGVFMGGGAAEDYITNPALIISQGWSLCEPTFKELLVGNEQQGFFATLQGAMDSISIRGMLNALGLFAVLCAIMIAFAIMALQISLTVIEFYVVGLIMYVLIPFGLVRPMAFMAEKAFGGIVTFGVKVGCLGIVSSVLAMTFSNVNAAKMDFVSGLQLLVLAIFLAFLTWIVPGMAASACGGAPSLGAASMVGGAAGAIASVARNSISAYRGRTPGQNPPTVPPTTPKPPKEPRKYV